MMYTGLLFLVTFAAPVEQSVDCCLTTTGVREDIFSPSQPCQCHICVVGFLFSMQKGMVVS